MEKNKKVAGFTFNRATLASIKTKEQFIKKYKGRAYTVAGGKPHPKEDELLEKAYAYLFPSTNNKKSDNK